MEKQILTQVKYEDYEFQGIEMLEDETLIVSLGSSTKHFR